MTRQPTRREFLKTISLVGAAAWVGTRPGIAFSQSPGEKLNVGVIGTAGRGAANRNEIARTENIVALCDVDEQRLAGAAEAHRQARRYVDFRRMLEQQDIDAVVVSTPDHTHAVAALAAMQRGRHVYCEKPLAHSIHEARLMAESAARHGVVTQMGNQRHASDALRRVVEILRSGALGTVHKVVAWSGKTQFGGQEPPRGSQPVPPHLNWDLWLGPAPERPYHATYHPRTWRGFWDFGSGNFGDMACHILDAPYWGLDLRYPSAVEAEGPPAHPQSAPSWLVVRLQFEREGQPAVEFVWYDGTVAPPDEQQVPEVAGMKLPEQGSLILGNEGRLFFSHSGELRLLPEEKFHGDTLPEPTLPRPKSHHMEWIEACKGRGRTQSDFEYGGRLTEAALAGVVAYRVGKRLEWDGERMRASNCAEAEAFIRPPMRRGWSLEA